MDAEMRAYAARKRSMAMWSMLLAGFAILALWGKSPYVAVALFSGILCGLLNALLSMWGNERLLDHRSVASFVLGSVLRMSVFGIVPVEFALHGPLWTMGIYFIGFFTPFGLYTLHTARTL
jgi:hypothetical protein